MGRTQHPEGIMRRAPLVATMVVMVLALAGCKRFGGPDGGDPVDQQQQDIEEYEDLCADLDSHRTEFLGDEADEVWAYGNHLFWLRFDAWAPTLHGWNAETDQRIDYSFSIGEGDHYNYRASLAAVATAEEAGYGDRVSRLRRRCRGHGDHDRDARRAGRRAAVVGVRRGRHGPVRRHDR
jgi:hypothetical protein